MSTSIARLVRALRRHMKLRQGELGDLLGVTQSTISRWETGQDEPTHQAVQSLLKVARAASFDTTPFITSEGAPVRTETPLVGYVGAGAEITPFPTDGPLEYLESPPGISERAVAVLVRGESMSPGYRDGAVLFYDEIVDPTAMVGRECVVHLTDGRKFIKIVTRGSRPNTYTLVSSSGAPIPDVRLDGASPIVWIKPAF